MSAIFPFIGHFILFGDKIHEWIFVLNRNYTASLGFPILTEISIYCLYYGLLSLGIGSILYSIFCPPEVRISDTSADYSHFRKWSEAESLSFTSWAKMNFGKFENNSDAEMSKYAQLGDNFSKDSMMIYYELQAQTKIKASFYTGLFYLAGILFTSFSALVTFSKITGKLLFDLWGVLKTAVAF
jgi:hypothetical protein